MTDEKQKTIQNFIVGTKQRNICLFCSLKMIYISQINKNWLWFFISLQNFILVWRFVFDKIVVFVKMCVNTSRFKRIDSSGKSSEFFFHWNSFKEKVATASRLQIEFLVIENSTYNIFSFALSRTYFFLGAKEEKH